MIKPISLLAILTLVGCVSKEPLPEPVEVIEPEPVVVIAAKPEPEKPSIERKPAIRPDIKVVRIELSKNNMLEMRQIAKPPPPVAPAEPAVEPEKPAPEPEDGVWFSATEITIAQYIAYLEETNEERGVDWDDEDCPITRGGGGYELSGNAYGDSPKKPMVEIDWNAAVRYCAWLTEKQKRDLPEGYAFRLPTRAEWEIAAAVDSEPDAVTRQAWTRDDSRGATHRVATKPAGAHGYHDFYGNVWEWSGTKTEKGAYKLNGGSWLTPLNYALLHNSFFPDETQSTVGFRLILLKD